MDKFSGMFGALLIGVIVILFAVNILPSIFTSIQSSFLAANTSAAQSVVNLNSVIVAVLPMAIIAAIIIYVLNRVKEG
jgi:hypothetical protein